MVVGTFLEQNHFGTPLYPIPGVQEGPAHFLDLYAPNEGIKKILPMVYRASYEVQNDRNNRFSGHGSHFQCSMTNTF